MKYRILTLALLSLVLFACSQKPVLYVFNWSDYIDPELINEFEKEFGCKIKYAFYDSNENMITKIREAVKALTRLSHGRPREHPDRKGLAEKLDKSSSQTMPIWTPNSWKRPQSLIRQPESYSIPLLGATEPDVQQEAYASGAR